jgi:hypothetical protein
MHKIESRVPREVRQECLTYRVEHAVPDGT